MFSETFLTIYLFIHIVLSNERANYVAIVERFIYVFPRSILLTDGYVAGIIAHSFGYICTVSVVAFCVGRFKF